MTKRFLLLSTLCLTINAFYAQNFSNGFNFVIPPFDASSQTFLPDFPAYTIEEKHQVKSSDGGSFTLPDGSPIRFWGVNIGASACFPPKNLAPGIAAHMRKMGINLVRFHHLDNPSWFGTDGSIFINISGTRQLNSITLDRMEYFISELKKNGIYVNMNLNTSRTFRDADGVLYADSIPEFGKIVTLFDPWMQFLQREFAEQLLGHTNPYTGVSLAKDPVLAMVELNNENGIYSYWKSNSLRTQAEGGWLLWRHNQMLDSLWNSWLLDKYNTQSALANAWNVGLVPPGLGNVVINGGFESGDLGSAWSLELHSTAQATASITNQNISTGSFSGQLQVANVTGTNWHIQFKNTGYSLKKDSIYVLKFSARSASGTKTLGVSVMRDNAPYTWYTGMTFQAEPVWKNYSITFKCTEDVLASGRISFSPENNTGTFYFDNVTLGPPSVVGILPGENLSIANVDRILYTEKLEYSTPRVVDMAAFYAGLEENHFDAFFTYLRNTLGVNASITGTNALSGPITAATNENMDYIDDHSYWDHPWFPGQPWDNNNWLIQNQSLLKTTDLNAISNIFSGLAMSNKPYTVSEYNHGFPNRFRTEMVPVLLAYSSFHGADGIMWFLYAGNNTNWNIDFVDGFFDLQSDHTIMAQFPAAAFAYRNGLIRACTAPIDIQYSREWLFNDVKNDPNGRWGKYYPYNQQLSLTQSIRTETYSSNSTTDFDQLPAAGTNPFVTQTGETTLDTEKGVLHIETDRYCAVAGFLQDAPNTVAGDMNLVSADGFGTVSWVALGTEPLNKSARSLLTVSSVIQNTGMIWNSDQTVNSNFGATPTQIASRKIVLNLKIKAEYIQIYPLNGKGEATAYNTVYPDANGVFTVTINQQINPTLWFGIRAIGGEVTGTTGLTTGLQVDQFPNPAIDVCYLKLSGSYTSKPDRIQVLDSVGKLVKTTSTIDNDQIRIDLSGLSSGHYFYLIQDNGGHLLARGSFEKM